MSENRTVQVPFDLEEVARWCLRNHIGPDDLPDIVEQLTMAFPSLVSELTERLHAALRTSQPVLAHVQECEACLDGLDSGLCADGRAIFDECRDYVRVMQDRALRQNREEGE
jgi:hypothetical protein